MKQSVVLLLATLLSACQVGVGIRYPDQVTSDNQYEITHFFLNKPFPIRADRASEYIQDGKITRYWNLSEYYPHCIFELRTVSDLARTVSPDTFNVTGIHRDRFMARNKRKIMLASLVQGGDGDNMLMSTTTYSLHSDKQPDVFRLSCQQLDEPYRARHVYNSEIVEVLGELFTAITANTGQKRVAR